MHDRSKSLRGLLACVALAWALAGCSDPYKQTLAPPGSDDYPAFARAVEKLPTEEKRLVNEYVARQERDGVRPVGVTVREAIDEEATYEREQAELIGKIAGGVGRVINVAGRVLASVLPPAPAAPPSPVGADPARSPSPVAPSPPAPPTDAPSPNRQAAPSLPPAAPTVATAPSLAPAPTIAGVPSLAPAPTAAPAPSLAPTPTNTADPAGAAREGAMTRDEFLRFLGAVEATPFPYERVARIKAMPAGQRVTAAQSIALAQTVPHPSLQVEALGALYPHVVDPQNFDAAYDTLTFADDRERLRNRVRALR